MMLIEGVTHNEVPRRGQTEPRRWRGVTHTALRRCLDCRRSARVGPGTPVVFFGCCLPCRRLGSASSGSGGYSLARSPPHASPHLLLGRRHTPAVSLEGLAIPRRTPGQMPRRRQKLGGHLLLPSGAPAMAVGVPTLTMAPSTWNATMRPWRQASAARSVGVDVYIGPRQAWISVWMGMHSCQQCAISWRSSGARRVAKCSRRLRPPMGPRVC
jgi:hypothetical protein